MMSLNLEKIMRSMGLWLIILVQKKLWRDSEDLKTNTQLNKNSIKFINQAKTYSDFKIKSIQI